MDSTVHPERKLMAETLSRPNESSTGLMMTPPPIPQMAPITHAPKLTSKKITYIKFPSFPCFVGPFILPHLNRRDKQAIHTEFDDAFWTPIWYTTLRSEKRQKEREKWNC